MTGILRDDIVEVRDQSEGSRLYSKGNYGYPRSGGGVDLDLAEAVYLSECGRLEVVSGGEPVPFQDLFVYSASVYEGFDIKYLVYRDLRQRGFVVRQESGWYDLSVFPRGKTLSNSRPEYYVKAVSERSEFSIPELIEQTAEAGKRGRSLLYGVADEEGDVTYYIISLMDPSGKVFVSDPESVPGGRLIRDRVFTWGKDAEILQLMGYFGKSSGDFLQLSLAEACYLVSRGKLRVIGSNDKEEDFESLRSFCRAVQKGFDKRLKVYTDLRERGLVVKSGFKYGNHFRAYISSPDDCHAKYLVHAITEGDLSSWSEVSKTVRLSGGVKKEILLGNISGKKIDYLEFRWFRP